MTVGAPGAGEGRLCSVTSEREGKGEGLDVELAESRGLTPEFSCRGGSCGTCKTKILSGQVSHISAPGVHLEADEALICCAVPAAAGSDTAPLVLDL